MPLRSLTSAQRVLGSVSRFCRPAMLSATGARFSVTTDPMRDLLTGDSLAEAQGLLPDWKIDRLSPESESAKWIKRQFIFENFADAFSWMRAVAERADSIDHHPDWSNCYNTVDVKLNTHTAEGVTSLDVTLASFMDEAYDHFKPKPAVKQG